MLFWEIDIIWNKIQNGGSDIECKHQHMLLSIKCKTHFIAITILEETRRHSWRKKT